MPCYECPDALFYCSSLQGQRTASVQMAMRTIWGSLCRLCTLAASYISSSSGLL